MNEFLATGHLDGSGQGTEGNGFKYPLEFRENEENDVRMDTSKEVFLTPWFETMVCI